MDQPKHSYPSFWRSDHYISVSLSPPSRGQRGDPISSSAAPSATTDAKASPYPATISLSVPRAPGRPDTNNGTSTVSHPLRPYNPKQGEVFYRRYIPWIGETLSFRSASLASTPVSLDSLVRNSSTPASAQEASQRCEITATTVPPRTDLALLHAWMNNPRVSNAWGMAGPESVQAKFLADGLALEHSFPVIGCWNGKPFGYFEIYWVKEDSLATAAASTNGYKFDDYDRGFHLLVGEERFRGLHRVKAWMSALVQYCFLIEPRTMAVYAEPNIKNEK